MKSVRAAVWCASFLVLLSASLMWVSTSALAIAQEQPGHELALHWRIGLALTTLYARYAPLVSIGLVALAAIAGAVLGQKGSRSVPEERRILGAWLLVAVAAAGIDLTVALPWRADGVALVQLWLLVDPILYLGLVAFVAAAVVAVHLQSRLHGLGSRVQGWHVAAATLALSALGPAGFLPPAMVWVYSGRGEQRTRRAAEQGDRAGEPRKEDGQ